MSDLFINFAMFNCTEQNEIMNIVDDREILSRAVAALNRILCQEKAMVEYVGDTPYLMVMGRRFACEVAPRFTIGMIDSKMSIVDKGAPIVYVTVNASPKMLGLAKVQGLNVLDCAGNCYIQYRHENGDIALMLANKGEKPVDDVAPKTYPIFLEKGLRVIFYLLLDKKNIGRPYREIKDATGVAIGTVKNIIDGMVRQQLARVEDGKRYILNSDRLLMLWSANYGQYLKPKLLQARYTFRDEEKRRGWRSLALPKGMVWGGEPAAAITDGYLEPGDFTIYADVPAGALMMTGAVEPDPRGEIAVYRKFWIGDNNAVAAPAILTYADLIDTANSRCVEAAQRIKESELKYLF